MAEAFVTGAVRPPSYRLPSHVFACKHGRHMILLDLKADRYFAVELPAGGIDRIARALIERGLLTAVTDQGAEGDHSSATAVAHESRAPPIEAPAEDLSDAALERPPRLALRDVRRFAVATACAWIAVHCLSLEHMVRRVSGRRARHALRGAGGTARSVDVAALRRCVAAYERLRPLAFGARDACLLQSYALLEFAARYGLYPTWVFGVQATPFAAHCWVQLGPLVLDDAAEHAAAFTPIMVA